MNNGYDNFGFNTNNNSNIRPSNIDYNSVQQPQNVNVPQQQSVPQPEEQYYSMGFNTEPPKKKRGGGFFSFLFALLLLIGLTLFLLDYTGKVDVKKYASKITHKLTKKEDKKSDEGDANKEDNEDQKEKSKEEKINYEEELKNRCSKEYTEEEETDGTNKQDFLREVIRDNEKYPDNDSAWGVLKGIEACNSKGCIVFENNESMTMYAYDCRINKYQQEQFDIDKLRSDDALDRACAAIDSDGDFDGDENDPLYRNATCEEFICKVTINEKERTRDCKE